EIPPKLFEAARDGLAGTFETALAQDGYHVVAIATRWRGALNGALLLWRPETDGPFAEADLTIMADVADQLGIAIAQVAAHERTVALSRTDTLTGLDNRRA